jgi:D-alanine-D-alanine ligase
MKTGLCYDLRDTYLSMGYSEEETAEFDKAGTIDSLENALQANGFIVERIGNAKQLIGQLTAGKSWDLVFNICEGLNGVGRESQVPAILDLYNIPYVFSGPMVLALCLHKAMTKRVVRDLGIATPDFFVIENENDIKNISIPYPLFVKPVAEGTGKGITRESIITDSEQLFRICRPLIGAYPQGILVERFLPGREFTVGITGNGNRSKAIGTLEIIHNSGTACNSVYSYETKENYQDLVHYRLAEKDIAVACQELALKVWKGLGCNDAGRVDLKLDENGMPSFIEVNPLAGLNPEHSDLPILARMNGIGFNNLIAMIMDAAVNRIYGLKTSPSLIT